MKIKYSKDADVLMITMSDKKLDDAYQVQDMIVQVAKDGEPVIIEILNASQFLKESVTQLPKTVVKTMFPSLSASFTQKTK